VLFIQRKMFRWLRNSCGEDYDKRLHVTERVDTIQKWVTKATCL